MGAFDTLKEKYGDDLQELVTKFESSGFGDKVKSWIGTGDNEPIGRDEVTQVLGQDEVDRIARETGRQPDDVADELSREIPRAVDEATPTGQMPAGAGRPTV